MIAKIVVITGLVIAYLLIGFLLLFVINKLSVLWKNDLILDDTTGAIFALLYPLIGIVILIDVLMHLTENAVEWINNKALGTGKDDKTT